MQIARSEHPWMSSSHSCISVQTDPFQENPSMQLHLYEPLVPIIQGAPVGHVTSAPHGFACLFIRFSDEALHSNPSPMYPVVHEHV